MSFDQILKISRIPKNDRRNIGYYAINTGLKYFILHKFTIPERKPQQQHIGNLCLKEKMYLTAEVVQIVITVTTIVSFTNVIPRLNVNK